MDIQIKQLDGKLLMAEDVARILNVSSARVRQLENEGKIPAARTVKGTRVFCVFDIEKFAKSKDRASK